METTYGDTPMGHAISWPLHEAAPAWETWYFNLSPRHQTWYVVKAQFFEDEVSAARY